MLSVTKIFSFEMAHAIAGYPGSCGHIHGHSYILHVTVSGKLLHDEPLCAHGFVVDFKLLKQLVQEQVVKNLDHVLVLSRDYLDLHPGIAQQDNLLIWDMEPSAENMLLYIRRQIRQVLPEEIRLQRLLLFETAGSCAEWTV